MADSQKNPSKKIGGAVGLLVCVLNVTLRLPGARRA